MTKHLSHSQEKDKKDDAGQPDLPGIGLRIAFALLFILVIAVTGVFLVIAGIVPNPPSSPTGGHQLRTSGDAQGALVVTDEQDESDMSLNELFGLGRVDSVRLIGDSITAGYLCDGFDTLPTGPTMVYSGPEGTAFEVSDKIPCWANDFRTWATDHGVTSFVNAGVSGWRMQYLAEHPEAWLGDGADVIVVMLGTNDASKCSIDDFRSYAETALDAAAAKCKRLVVVTPPDNRRTDARVLYSIDQVDEVLTQICEQRGYEHYSLYDALELYSDDFNRDQVHPTSAGSHKLWLSLKEQMGLAD